MDSKQSAMDSEELSSALLDHSPPNKETPAVRPKEEPKDVDEKQVKKVKRKKKKVEMACVYCRRSHMICDDTRPCQRCIKRGIGHLCHDESTPGRQKKNRKLENSINGANSPMTTSELQNETLAIAGDNPQSPPISIFGQGIPLSGKGSTTNLNKNLTFNQEPFFYSEHAGSEFSSLNDFLSMIDDPELVNGALNDNNNNTDSLMAFLLGNSDQAGSQNVSAGINNMLPFSPNVAQMQAAFPDVNLQRQKVDNQTFSTNQNQNYQEGKIERVQNTSFQKPQPLPVDGNHQPMISDSARDKFFLTAADPTTEISPEERLKQVIKAKLEAGLLQPYNYAKGYARLQSYMDNYMNQSSRQRILKPLSIFRPAFRAIARTLKDVDLVLVEESFERMLLDYDRVFTSMAIPACLWRRTGEIYRGNKEFASMVGVTTDDLKDGKLAIYELMSEESAVNFWEKYGAIAFDKGQKAVLTSCNLRTKDGLKRKSCCFSFTIRRDRYNIPSCIVGNFIPIEL